MPRIPRPSGADPVIGRRIRAARKAKDMTLKELANKIGITPTHLSKIESGHYGTTNSRMVKIALALGMSLGQLLGGEAHGSDFDLKAYLRDEYRLPESEVKEIMDYIEFKRARTLWAPSPQKPPNQKE